IQDFPGAKALKNGLRPLALGTSVPVEGRPVTAVSSSSGLSRRSRARRCTMIAMTGQAGHDQVETITCFVLILWVAHNPLIRRYFLWVFRFAKMALANARP